MKNVREFIDEFSTFEIIFILIFLGLIGSGAGYYAATSLSL